MQPKDKQKMCSQCDGRIAFDAEVCPYCAADQLNAPFSNGSQPLQSTLTTPCSFKSVPQFNSNKPVSESMVEKKINASSSSLGIPSIPAPAQEPVVEKEGRGVFLPILLISLASNLLAVGLLQLLFSDRGVLRLEWDSSYWFIYCLISLPLFFFGLNAAKRLQD